MSNTKNKGDLGERIARNYLCRKGYNVITNNYKVPYGEVDIIAKSPDGVFVFCEVKHYKKNYFLHPLEKISNGQLKRIYWVAETFMESHEKDLFQVDLIVVENNLVVNHFQNVS